MNIGEIYETDMLDFDKVGLKFVHYTTMLFCLCLFLFLCRGNREPSHETMWVQDNRLVHFIFDEGYAEGYYCLCFQWYVYGRHLSENEVLFEVESM